MDHHAHHHPHLQQPPTSTAAGATAVPMPPPHSQSQPPLAQDQTEDPQVLFKTAANALAQLYRRSITPDRRAHSRGYAAALNDVNASLDSLPDHPLSVQSNGRTFVPLDLVKHLVAALGVQASEHNAMLEEHDHPMLMPTLSPMMPGLMGIVAPASTSAQGTTTAGPSQASSAHQHQQHHSGLSAPVSSSTPAGSGIASAAPGGGTNSSVASGSAQQGSSSTAQHPASKTPMFPWMLDGEPTRKRPRDF
ncbi:hypothetical protein BCR44DRAFT_1436953 [Catenaria anguillulae PL171]|uniref:Uncharacterized protein n=1 Tax=Catenaria anguillulae PL171 TaxID=765915 RepID=A0A1Y2HHE7_9FUNG|nr:hypothetical protein BCR44DRAFT_1436953 [Catenaria anguillulae PL171]